MKLFRKKSDYYIDKKLYEKISNISFCDLFDVVISSLFIGWIIGILSMLIWVKS